MYGTISFVYTFVLLCIYNPILYDSMYHLLQELVSMIKNPGPFIAAGARLPSGLLMVGPPGTGKTLMARVMAAEAGVPVGS